MTTTADYDCIVIGGGPAGATGAAALARRGRRVLVLEAERFPRFHIGESLLPAGWPVYDAIGCTDAVKRADFTQKYGVVFIDETGDRRVVFDLASAGPWANAIQVHRAEFDQLLLDHAVACGAELEVARAVDFETTAEDVTVTFGDGGDTRRVRAKSILDASGRAGFITKREGLREPDPRLRNAAVYAHFRGVPRSDDERRAGDTLIVSTLDLGWAWVIPLRDGVTSVGVVMDLDRYRTSNRGDPAELLDRAIQANTALRELMAGAERINDARVESDFSYRPRRFWGQRWVAAGDAGAFLDPVFSSGVQLALDAGVEAAAAIDAAFVAPRSRPSALRKYERQQRRKYEFARRFVVGFYDPHTRDLLFSPKPYFGIPRAILSFFAGGYRPGRLDRIRLAIFFGFAWLQRHVPLVERIHGAAPAPKPTVNARPDVADLH